MTRILVASILAAWCIPAAAADVSSPATDYLAEARATIEAANADWVPAMKRKDAKAIASFYADDGVLVGPNGKAIQGRDAVAGAYAKGMEVSRFLGGNLVQEGVVLAAGPVIYEWGRAEFDVERDGKVVHGEGNYVTVWKRDASGAWRISRNLAM